MTWSLKFLSNESPSVAKVSAENEIDRLFESGARYVLVLSGDNFMAVSWDGSHIDSADAVDGFMHDVNVDLRREALREIRSKGSARPNHLAVILAIM